MVDCAKRRSASAFCTFLHFVFERASAFSHEQRVRKKWTRRRYAMARQVPGSMDSWINGGNGFQSYGFDGFSNSWIPEVREKIISVRAQAQVRSEELWQCSEGVVSE